ncbi:MAG: hypothetical protein ABFD64_02955 [Armatimonadota bacterium]
MKTVLSANDYPNVYEYETALLKEQGIAINSDRVYSVPSSDGQRHYQVKFVGRSEDGFAKLWDCNCAAARNGKTCKHIKLVAEIVNYASDQFGYE